MVNVGFHDGAAYSFEFYRVLNLDIKCNGQDKNVIISSGNNVALDIDIENGYQSGLEGDFWILAISPTPTWNVWTHGPWLS